MYIDLKDKISNAKLEVARSIIYKDSLAFHVREVEDLPLILTRSNVERLVKFLNVWLEKTS